jgi:anti-anti-sigma regulatory factor
VTHARDEFGVTISMRKGVAHLEVKGAVDDAAAPTLQQLLSRLPEADVQAVVVDLTRASELSCEAQRTVEDSLDVLRREGGSGEVHRPAG